MLLHQRFITGLAIASYIVGDERTGEAAMIDPTRDVEEYLAFAKDNDLHIRHILETPIHADFVSGARSVQRHVHSPRGGHVLDGDCTCQPVRHRLASLGRPDDFRRNNGLVRRGWRDRNVRWELGGATLVGTGFATSLRCGHRRGGDFRNLPHRLVSVRSRSP